MIKNIKILFSFYLLLFITENSFGMLLEEKDFEKIKMSNFPRSAFSAINFWKGSSEEDEATAFLATHEADLENWDLDSEVLSKEGKLYIYRAASDKDIYNNDIFKKQLNKFSKVFEDSPEFYFESFRALQTFTELSQQNYDADSLESIHQRLVLADNIFFAIGAGISTPIISDLSSGLSHFELVQIPSTDLATCESYRLFAEQLISNSSSRASVIEEVKKFTNTCWQEKKSPTKAHHALANIVQLLKNKKKTVFVYSSNIDGLEQEVGIFLREATDKDENVYSIMPELEVLTNKNSIILAIGKSSDHGGDLAKLYSVFSTLGDKAPYDFFSLNLKPSPIIVDKVPNAESTSSENLFVLPMKWVQGDIQNLLPELEQMLQ